MTLPATTDIHRNSGEIAQMAALDLNLRNKSDRRYLSTALADSTTRAATAWQHYHRLGAIRYPLNRAARIAGSARLYAAEVEDGKIVGKSDDPLANEIVNGIYSRVGGVRGLIQRYFLLMKVPADAHLIAFRKNREAPRDGYMFVSPNELSGSPDGTDDKIEGDLFWDTRPNSTAPDGSSESPHRRKLARRDYLGRVWAPDPQYLDIADSPLFTLDIECDLLYRLMLVLSGQMHSRAVMNGIAFFPDTLQNLAAGKITASGGHQLLVKLNEVLTKNMDLVDKGDATSVAKILLSGHPDAGNQIKEIFFGRETQAADLQLRSELTERILFALDINARQARGDSETRFQNFSDGADELRLAVIPDIEAMVWSMTRLILHREMQDAGASTDRILSKAVWYDLSAAAVRINREDSARQLIDRGGLALRSAREEGGFEEADAPNEEEYVRQLGWRNRNPYLATWGMDVHDELDYDLAFALPEGRPVEADGDEPISGPGVGDPGDPDDTETDDVP